MLTETTKREIIKKNKELIKDCAEYSNCAVKERKTKYPKMPREFDRRFKLTEDQIRRIKREIVNSYPAELGRKYGVSEATIRYHTNDYVNGN